MVATYLTPTSIIQSLSGIAHKDSNLWERKGQVLLCKTEVQINFQEKTF